MKRSHSSDQAGLAPMNSDSFSKSCPTIAGDCSSARLRVVRALRRRNYWRGMAEHSDWVQLSSSPTGSTTDFEGIFGPGPPPPFPPNPGPLNVSGQSAVASALSQGFLSTGFGNKARGLFTAGATFGLNFQMAQIVFGLEADWAWMGGKARTNQFATQVPVPSGTATSVTITISGAPNPRGSYHLRRFVHTTPYISYWMDKMFQLEHIAHMFQSEH